jgi:predicted nucleotidyltransferase
MARVQNPNIEVLSLAISQLGELSDEMVFVGGCATGLLISDAAAPPIRVTRDVDAIIQVLSRADYYKLADRLRNKGFSEDYSDGAPLCRWVNGVVVLDVMPTDESIMGFGNRWYKAAAETAGRVVLPSGREVLMITAPYFIMTKLDAFDSRGNGDYLMSHDMEDIVAVLDGRPEVADEIKNSKADLQSALANRFSRLLQDARFVEAVPGHLPPEFISHARVPAIMRLIENIADLPVN